MSKPKIKLKINNKKRFVVSTRCTLYRHHYIIADSAKHAIDMYKNTVDGIDDAEYHYYDHCSNDEVVTVKRLKD